MSTHVIETCNESNGLWLPLTEYSVRSGISTSTIRRKIKSNSIQYRLEKGKYFILFDGKETTNASTNTEITEPKSLPQVSETREKLEQRIKVVSEPQQNLKQNPWGEQSVKFVNEAFERKLKEKEDRIRFLEQRNANLEEKVNELRLLVQVLEEKYQVRY